MSFVRDSSKEKFPSSGAPIFFQVISYIRFKIVQPLNHTIILHKRMNTFLPISPIRDTMEVSSIRVSFKDKFALRALVPFDLLLPKEACYLRI
jgi:hypothetical protein